MKRIFCFVIAIVIFCPAVFCVGFGEPSYEEREEALLRFDPEELFNPQFIGMDEIFLMNTSFEPFVDGKAIHYFKDVSYYGHPAQVLIQMNEHKVFSVQYVVDVNDADTALDLKNMIYDDMSKVYNENQLIQRSDIEGRVSFVFIDNDIRDAIETGGSHAEFMYMWNMSPFPATGILINDDNISIHTSYIKYDQEDDESNLP